jgi:cell division protein FtsL
MQERRQRRRMYYVDGSTVRKTEYEAYPSRKYDGYPDRRRRVDYPDRREERRKLTREEEKKLAKKQRNIKANKKHKALMAKKTARSQAFDFTYTAIIVLAFLVMVASSAYMLRLEQRVREQETNITKLSSQLDTLKSENMSYSDSLENMYTLDEIYKIATRELGMVYSTKGQIIYYDSANEDYVTQFEDVPEAK